MGWAELLAQVEVQVQEAQEEDFPRVLFDLERLRLTLLRRLQEAEVVPAPLLTVAQLATKLQVNPATLYRRVQRGQMRATKVGRCVRLAEADFQQRLKRGPRRKRLIDL
jgi:excisionase family DNA binding protein